MWKSVEKILRDFLFFRHDITRAFPYFPVSRFQTKDCRGCGCAILELAGQFIFQFLASFQQFLRALRPLRAAALGRSWDGTRAQASFGARAPSVTIGASREFGARAPSVTIGALPDRNAAGKVVFGGFRVQIWRKLGVPCRARARNGPGARGAPAGARKGPCRARNPFRAPARNNSEPGWRGPRPSGSEQ